VSGLVQIVLGVTAWPGRRVMAVTESDARARLFPLIKQVNADQEPVEIVSRKGTAFLVSAAQYR
jgi:prevent-host-death family protein